MRSDSIEWKSILGRKHKRGVMKVIGTLAVKVGIESKNL